jgi:exopolyphosphatase / guanosine-5'-triphosphate,3'-diphosphate pyrophosphatase
LRVAVIDIGTNSTRLLVADVTADDELTERERRTKVTRLGDRLGETGVLGDEAMARVLGTVREYLEVIHEQGAERAIAVLTSAVRDAANGEEFARTVGERFGLAPHVLSGDDEAKMTFLGATSERDLDDETPTLVIDIGGGSTETVIGRPGREPEFHVSNQAGVVRQTERHLASDPPRRSELDALREDVRAIFVAAVPQERRRAVGQAIAVAGTATSLAAIAQSLDPYDPSRVHGFHLTRAECARMLGELAAVPVQERRKVAGLHPDRAPTIVAGVLILLEVLELFGLDNVEVSEHDILRGAALALTRK